MKEYKDVKVSDFEISLVKAFDKRVTDIYGYISTEFDDETFKLTKIVFEDGSEARCEGEHDFPYLTGLDEAVLENIYKTDPVNESES